MKTPRVLKYSNLPTTIPLCPTATAWLLLDWLKAPGWVWGAVGVLFLIVWISCIYRITVEEKVDIFADEKADKASWPTQ